MIRTTHPMKKGFLLSLFVVSPMLWGAGTSAWTDAVPLTRAEAVTVLLQLRTRALPEVRNEGRFADVKKGRKYEKYVLAAERLGILQADGQKHLYPDTPVSRAGFLKMITLTFGLETRTPHAFKDVSATSWYSPYAGIAARYSLFSRSDGVNILRPDALLTKTEATNVLQAMISADAFRTVTGERTLSYEQFVFSLTIYDKISTEKAEVTRLPSFTDTVAVPEASAQAPVRLSIVTVKDRVVALVNEERVKRGIPPLHRDAVLCRSAQKYSEELLTKGYFSHVSPNGETLRDRMEDSGYYKPAYETEAFSLQQFTVGENLARGQKSADEVVKDWMNSASHRAVLLNPSFKDTGVGVAAGIWVQHFGGVRFADEE